MSHLLVALLILLSTNYAVSGESLRSDFYFPLKASAVNEILQSGAQGEIAQSLDNIVVEVPYKSIISRVRLGLSYEYNLKTKQRQGLTTPFELNIISPVIRAAKISTNHLVRSENGNIVLDVIISGSCDNIAIRPMSESFTISGDLILENQRGSEPKAQSQIRDLNWPRQWQVSLENCQGPAGYEEGVKQALIEAMPEQKDFVEALLKEELDQTMKNLLAESFDILMSPQEMKLNKNTQVTLQPQEVALDEETGGLVLSGDILAHTDFGIEKVSEIPFAMSDEDAKAYQKTSGLILSNEFLNALIGLAYRGGEMQKSVRSQSVAGLKKLHRSRFLQFFLFPDLLKFDKKADFNLVARLDREPQMSFHGQQSNYSLFSYQGGLIFDLQAPKSGDHIDYLHFKMPLTGYIGMQVREQKLRVRFGEPSSELKAYWNKDYTSRYKTNKRLSTGFIKSQLNKFIEQQTLEVELPEIVLSADYKLVPQNMLSTKKASQLVFDLQAHK